MMNIVNQYEGVVARVGIRATKRARDVAMRWDKDVEVEQRLWLWTFTRFTMTQSEHMSLSDHSTMKRIWVALPMVWLHDGFNEKAPKMILNNPLKFGILPTSILGIQWPTPMNWQKFILIKLFQVSIELSNQKSVVHNFSTTSCTNFQCGRVELN